MVSGTVVRGVPISLCGLEPLLSAAAFLYSEPHDLSQEEKKLSRDESNVRIQPQ